MRIKKDRVGRVGSGENRREGEGGEGYAFYFVQRSVLCDVRISSTPSVIVY
jgi:hypothetical protein